MKTNRIKLSAVAFLGATLLPHAASMRLDQLDLAAMTSNWGQVQADPSVASNGINPAPVLYLENGDLEVVPDPAPGHLRSASWECFSLSSRVAVPATFNAWPADGIAIRD